MSDRLSHYDEQGRPSMVDVSEKAATKRTATAQAFVRMNAQVLGALPHNPKGNPLEVARIAGIQAAKRTSDLIPLCHPLPLSHADVRCVVEAERRANHCHSRYHRADRGRNGGLDSGRDRCSDGI